MVKFLSALSLGLGLGFGTLVAADLSASALESHVETLDLGNSFSPIKAAYWTGLPHHRRTPFAVSPSGDSAYLAYLDASETDVHVVEVDPSTFKAKGTPVTVTGGKEAGGLVAQDDGFALLTNVAVTGTNAPPSGTPVPVIVRYKGGKESWRTFVGGPGVHESDGLSASPDMNGDLVYSSKTGLYGAYFVITDYSGDASGHFGDSVQYVNDSGELQSIAAASSWGCSHNTGIAFEAADAVPYASICAEDHGAIWLNTETRTMDGVKIANENTTNGASGEPMGGMSGSYSSLARFVDSDSYIFAWRSRGAVNLVEDSWMGAGFTQCSPRWLNGNVAIAVMTDKNTLAGKEAISTVGAAEGDSQVTWITNGEGADHENVHAAAFDKTNALITWEEITSPSCDNIAMGCAGTFSGTYFQQVDSTGAKVGASISSDNIYVAGDIVNIGSKLCWPYVHETWDLSSASVTAAAATKMSFACISTGSGSATTSAGSSAASSSSAATSAAVTSAAAVNAAAAVPTSSAPEVGSAVTPVSPVLSSPYPTTLVSLTRPARHRPTAVPGSDGDACEAEA